MTHWRALRDEEYLGAWDFEDPESLKKPLKIKKVEQATVFNKQKNKEEHMPIVFFAGIGKGMLFNVTNCDRLTAMFESDYESWVGKHILIRLEKANRNGVMVDALRVNPKKVQADPPASKPTPPDEDEPAPEPRAQTAPSKVKVAKDELWSLLTHVHQGADRRDAEAMKVAIEQVNEHLQGEGYMRTDETIGKLSLDRMEEIITLLKQAEEL